MKTRVLAAIPLVLCLLGAAFIQSWFLVAFLVFISLMGQNEIIKAFNGADMRVYGAVSFCFALALSVLFALSSLFPDASVYSLLNITVIFSVFILLIFVITIFSAAHNISYGINTVFTLVYPQLFFALLYYMFMKVASGDVEPFVPRYWHIFIVVLWVFLPANFTDTFAYLIGRSFGKKKLAPEISPKKTVGGSIGGIIGGTVCGLLLGLLSDYLNVNPVNIVFDIIIGALIGVLAQFGDLSASLIKRKLNVKDFGKLIPGHGGIIDRVDSILYCVPLIFICTTFNIL